MIAASLPENDQPRSPVPDHGRRRSLCPGRAPPSPARGRAGGQGIGQPSGSRPCWPRASADVRTARRPRGAAPALDPVRRPSLYRRLKGRTTMRLQDKVAIVTGAGCGFGEGIARRFAAEGAKVLVADIDGARAERVADAIGGAAPRLGRGRRQGRRLRAHGATRRSPRSAGSTSWSTTPASRTATSRCSRSTRRPTTACSRSTSSRSTGARSTRCRCSGARAAAASSTSRRPPGSGRARA